VAFYPYDATRQAIQSIGSNDRLRADGVGAYYAEDMTHEAVQPINGLALGSSASYADDAIRALVGRRRPLLVAREWGVRVSDVSWKAPTTSDELTLIPITDAELRWVRRVAGGHEVPLVAILTDRLPTMTEAAAFFHRTPYALSEVIALAAVGDARPLPTPRFLLTAHLRDAGDEDAGSGLLAAGSAAPVGQLVYPIALPAKEKGRPLPPIGLAVAQLPPAQAPQMPGAPPPPPTPNVIHTRPGAAGIGTPFSQKGVLGAITTPQAIGIGAVVLAAAAGTIYLTRHR
jgi:hypothetical protein